jgi:hypothetical protein
LIICKRANEIDVRAFKNGDNGKALSNVKREEDACRAVWGGFAVRARARLEL